MTLCNITGTIYIPNGDVAAGYNVYLTKQQENVAADYLGSVIPETIRVQVDSSGEVDFNILSGMYSGVAGPRGGGKGFSFTFAAPDAASALFEDCIDAIAPDPVPPEWLQRVEQAVADAEAAAAAAEEAATTAADGAIEAVRSELDDEVQAASDAADRAEGYAQYVGQRIAYVLQKEASLPPVRPFGEVVHFYTWTDPSSMMVPNVDVWYRLPDPSVPTVPLNSSWDVFDMRNSTSIIIKATRPQQSPPITSIQYQVDGGSWVSMAQGSGEVIVSGFSIGDTPVVRLRYVNFVGAGLSDQDGKSTTITSGNFVDNFSYPNGYLSNNPPWVDVVRDSNSRGMWVESERVRTFTTNNLYVAQVNSYFPDDQFVEAQVLGAGSNNSNPRGVAAFIRMPDSEHSGYCFRVSNSAWSVYKITSGAHTLLDSGVHANSRPFTIRLSAIGSVITSSINGGVVSTVNDTLYSSGTVGMAVYAAGVDGNMSVNFDNLVAGSSQ